MSKKSGKTEGLIFVDEERSAPDYRLYNSRHGEAAVLLGREGEVIHRWSYPQGQSWHYAEMLANGHLVAIIKDQMILELNWESELVWKCETRAHHDFARLPDRKTLVLSRKKKEMEEILPGKEVSYDFIFEVDENNQVLWTWQVEKHAQELGDLVELIGPGELSYDDWPHINTLEVLPQNPSGERDETFREGNLLMCGRHINAIWIVDRGQGSIVWAWGTEELLGPHMPTMLKNGHILLFDNGDHTAQNSRGYTRILELDPLSEEIVWEYKADPPEEFFSPRRGSAQRLSNGNTLIAESDSGRLFEVTPAGQTVWEFVNPETSGGSPDPIYRVVGYPQEVVEGDHN